MKILSVTQTKPIQVREGSFVYPISPFTKITLDKKKPANKKEHQLIYQQGRYYGQVGDCCTYLSNDQLFELERRGMISIRKTK